jgi:hypothetical protein
MQVHAVEPGVGATLFVGQGEQAPVVTVGVGAYVFAPHVHDGVGPPTLVLPAGQAVQVFGVGTFPQYSDVVQLGQPARRKSEGLEGGNRRGDSFIPESLLPRRLNSLFV